MSTTPTILYADFSCPWSYLAYRRLAMLATVGEPFELRAVEHDPWQARPRTTADDRFASLREEMEKVSWHLRPGEDLPYTLRGFVPITRPAVSGYAEAFGAGVADVAAPCCSRRSGATGSTSPTAGWFGPCSRTPSGVGSRRATRCAGGVTPSTSPAVP